MRTIHNTSPRPLTEQLTAAGYKFLNCGAFAHVFEHPNHPTRVLKVVDEKYNRNYVRYIKWCVAHQDNPHVPRVFEMTRLCNVKKYEFSAPSQWLCIAMERLESNIARTHSLRMHVENSVEKYCRKMKRVARSHEEKVFKAIAKIGRSTMVLDIGGNNIMYRGDTHVLTDPLCR